MSAPEAVRGSGRRGAVTLTDVARVAGVSVSTAARVLREQETKVDQGMVARVRAAAEELGYVPNIIARSLRGGGPTTVGLIVGDMLDPYYGAIAENVTEAAESEHSMLAIVSNMQRSASLEIKHARQLWGHQVAGFILAGGGFDQRSHFEEFRATIEQIQRSGVVIVSLSDRGIPTLPTFCVDATATGALMAGHLLERGHREIGVLTGPMLSVTTRLRVESIVHTVEAAGGRVVALNGDYTPESGERLAQELIARHPGVTGAVVGTDSMALGALAGFARAGLSSPEDISVISAGNSRLAQLAPTRLTTVDLRFAECCRMALDYIAVRVAGEEPPSQPALEPLLVERDSVRRIS